MRKHLFTVIVAFLIAVVLLLYLFSFQVRVNEKAVVTTFGNPKLSIENPGLYWKWPFPVQKVFKFDSRLRIFECQRVETPTRDQRNIILVTSVGWKIADPLTYLKVVGKESDAEKIINDTVKDCLKVLGRHNLSELISTDVQQLKFDEIENEMLSMASGKTSDRYGISIELLKIKQLALPPEVLEAVFKRMRSERQIEASKLRAEGEGEANKISSAAISKRENMLAEAEADAKRIMGEGDARSAEYYKVFDQNPELAMFLNKLEVLRETLAKRATIVVDLSTMPFDLLKIPEVKKPEETTSK